MSSTITELRLKLRDLPDNRQLYHLQRFALVLVQKLPPSQIKAAFSGCLMLVEKAEALAAAAGEHCLRIHELTFPGFKNLKAFLRSLDHHPEIAPDRLTLLRHLVGALTKDLTPTILHSFLTSTEVETFIREHAAATTAQPAYALGLAA